MKGNLMEKSSPFITTDEAIKLINQHTQDKPTVDLLFLVENVGRIRTGRNFTIKRLQKVDGKISRQPEVYVDLVDDSKRELHREMLRDAIKTKFQEVTGRELNVAALGLSSKSTAIADDGALRNMSGRPLPNPDGIKLGDTIKSGVTATTNVFGA